MFLSTRFITVPNTPILIIGSVGEEGRRGGGEGEVEREGGEGRGEREGREEGGEGRGERERRRIIDMYM